MTGGHRTRHHSAGMLLSWVMAVAATAVFPLPLAGSAPDSGTELLGLRMGMTTEAIKEECVKHGIPVREIDAETFSLPRAPTPLAGAAEVRLTFERQKLKKIVVLFLIPPPEPTAANLIQRYNEEKNRLTKLFGLPAQDTVEMKTPDPAERYQWLTRGRGYYRCSWKIPDQTEISLWLYGEDTGIALMEIYEDSQIIR